MERVLRPQAFEEFGGQPQLVENLKIFIEAARRRRCTGSCTSARASGSWKTTLSHIIANELEVQIKVTSGPVLEKPGDLAVCLPVWNPETFSFIDEIHRLGTVIEEYLYQAMEDFKIDIMIETGPNARVYRSN